MIKDTEMEHDGLVSIIRKSFEDKNQALFNNAAQSYNHAFYWHCLKPIADGGGGLPPPRLTKLIDRDFGSFEEFKAQFAQAAMTQFGSGWAWLVWTQKGLSIKKTSNADCPLTEKEYLLPVLVIDVWEHAYYLDVQNMRQTYVDNFFSIVNWGFAEEQLPLHTDV